MDFIIQVVVTARFHCSYFYMRSVAVHNLIHKKSYHRSGASNILKYRKVYNIWRTKSQNLNASRVIL